MAAEGSEGRGTEREPPPIADAATLDGPLPPGERPARPEGAATPVIGPYFVLGKLGEGGMGIVYEAEQRQPRRRVALKVIRGGAFVDEHRVRMFQREIETLARLKHPNIGAIYDAGRTDGGEHYFAMELVRGRTLDEYMASRPARPDRDELRFRIALFLAIADAVHYAHLRGVIHRDLKPSNLVVPDVEEGSAESGLPAVKILDFGLARITDGDVAAATKMTEIGVIKGTLQYMSPEQARGNPNEIDVRADVYALGAILFEMLTGSRPYDLERKPFLEALRFICEQPPRTLAEVWRGPGAPDEDLSTIVGKALEKEADRRYESAAALAEDLRLWLDSRPILARAPSTVDRLLKFTRRNRAFVGGMVATFLALVAGVAASTTFALREARERRVTESARADLESVVAFQREMLDGVDARRLGRQLGDGLRERHAAAFGERAPGATPAEAAAAGKPLDDALARINLTDAALAMLDHAVLAPSIDAAKRRFASQPLVEARLLRSIGGTYHKLGLFDRGEAPLLEAARTLERLLGAESKEALEARHKLGNLYTDQGRFEDAERELVAARAGFLRTLGPDDDLVAMSTNDLAILFDDSGRHEESKALFAEAKASWRKRHGEGDSFFLNMLNNEGQALLHAGDLDAAIATTETALNGLRRVLGNENAETMNSVNNLAVMYRRKGDLARAEELFLEDLAMTRSLLGDEHPNVLVTMTNLGRVYNSQERFAEAVPLLARALEISGRVQPPGFYGTAITRQAYGDALAGVGRTADAERELLAADAALLAALGAEAPARRRAVESLANLYEKRGRVAEAEAWRKQLRSD